MCINADESEPGTFNNRILMKEDPHQVLEGAILSSYATGASTAYIYLRYEYPSCYRRLQQAIDECYEADLLGKNILGGEYSLDMVLHRGAAAYICGEETGLLESLEGRRAWPRIKPPFPAIEGAFRKPTVINNIETVCCVTHIIDRGADWFKSMGVPPDPDNPRDIGSFGPKLYCLSGHVERPGCYEAPLGLTCRQLIEDFGGGVWKGRQAKAAVPGGISIGLLTADELDTPLVLVGPAASATWDLARRLWWCSTKPFRWSIFCTTVAGSFNTKAVANARPVAKGRPGRPRCSIGSRRAEAGCKISTCCWRSATRLASCQAQRSADWPTAPPGRSRTRSASFAANLKRPSDAPIRMAMR